MKTRTTAHFFVGLAIFVLLLAGCQQGSGPKGEEGKGLTKVTYRLKWLFNASTAGDLWAKEKGIFQQHGLDVDLKEGGAEQDAIEEIELGRAQFGVASADQVLRAVSKGADVLVLAQIFQVNPLQWIYMKSRLNIEPGSKASLKSVLEKATVGITYGGNDEAIFMALAKSLGLDPSRLHTYAITYDYSPFWQGKVQLWPCYRNTQGIALAEKMREMNDRAGFVNPADYGIRFVANSLVTSKRFAKEHPQVVKAFTAALMEGWARALQDENLKDMVAILARYEKTLEPGIIEEQIRATKPLVVPKDQKPLGYIDKKAWKQTEKVMFQEGLLSKRVEVEELFVCR
ncbi:MAG: ABC transporter substrate-binding protein [Thermodesulfobacteria bacterium]|nr:ABC transporter substrate-binding protein [Thermodesulfobacteriota bacterium]